jgi:hypothetical protein
MMQHQRRNGDGAHCRPAGSFLPVGAERHQPSPQRLAQFALLKAETRTLFADYCVRNSQKVLRGCIKTSNGTFDGSAKIPRCHDRLSNSTDRVDAHLTQKFSSSAMWLVRSLRFTLMDWPSCAHAARNIGTKSGGN